MSLQALLHCHPLKDAFYFMGYSNSEYNEGSRKTSCLKIRIWSEVSERFDGKEYDSLPNSQSHPPHGYTCE